MPELPPEVQPFILPVAAVLLYIFAWVSVGRLPRWGKILARLAITALFIAPLLMSVVFMGGADRSAQMEPREYRSPPAGGSAERKKDFKNGDRAEESARLRAEQERQAAEREALRRQQEEAATKSSDDYGKLAEAPPPPPPLDEEMKPGAPAPLDGMGGGAPPLASEPAPASPAPPGDTAEQPPASGGDPLGGSGPPPPDAARAPDSSASAQPPPTSPPPSPVADDKKWDVVPVYYGTDRAEVAGERVAFGPDRGRKLILGRALVSVPKSHEVPQVERPWALRIPYFNVTVYEAAEDPDQHFTMQEIKQLSKDELIGIVRERLAASARYKDHALVFVHGFNTTFDNAVYRTAQMAYDLKFDGAPFLYSWPSGGGVASYTYDRESAGQSVPFLREFLETVIKETGAKSVSVIAHSMGNQPLLQVLRDFKSQVTPGGIAISQVILAAPDVDRDNFENIAKDIQGVGQGITMYAASNDRALAASRRFNGGVPRAGDVPLDTGPIIVPGIDTIDITAASTDSLSLNHSGYATSNALLEDIGLLIQSGVRPPGARFPALQEMPTAKGAYWAYKVPAPP